MYKAIFIGLLGVILAFPAMAEKRWESKEALASELMDVIHVRHIFNEGIKGITQEIVREFLLFECITSGELIELRESIQNLYVFEDYQERYVNAYIENFTYSELREIYQFYVSLTGQKLLRRTPAIHQKLYQIADGLQKERFEEVQRYVIELKNENLNEDGECE